MEPSGSFNLFGWFQPGPQGEGGAAAAGTSTASSNTGRAGIGTVATSKPSLADDDADSPLRRKVRARWSLCGRMSEWELQRLLEEVITGQEQQGKGLPVNHTARSSSSLGQTVAASDGAGVAGPVWTASDMDDSVLIQTEVVLSSIVVTLYTEGDKALASLCFDNLNVGYRRRARLGGIGLSCHIGTVELTDLSTQYAETLSSVLKGAPSQAGGQWLALGIETEPLHSSAALHLDARLAPTSLLFNPRFMAKLIAYLQVPPSQWAAAIALESVARDVVSNIVGVLRDAAITLWRQRPVLVSISIASPSIIWIEPPRITPPALSERGKMNMAKLLDVHAIHLGIDELLLSSEDALMGAQSANSSGIATEQAFTLSLLAICVRHLSPQGVMTLLRERAVGKVLETDHVLEASPSLVAPLSARACASVLLQTAPADVPWVSTTLGVDVVRISISEEDLTPIANLALATGRVLEPDALPVMPSPYAFNSSSSLGATDNDTNSGAGHGGGGWFLISEQRSFEGRSETTLLGTAWAYLELGVLVYELPREGEGGSTRRVVRLTDWHLRGGRTAEEFQLASEMVAVGVRYAVTITLRAATRSVAARFLSACAAMQMHTRVEARLSRDAQREQAVQPLGSSGRQLRLRLSAKVEGVELSLLSIGHGRRDPIDPSAMESVEVAHLKVGKLCASLQYRKKDLTVSTSLESVHAAVAVAPEHAQSPSANHLAPIFQFGTSSHAIEVAATLVSQGSPSYDQAQARVEVAAGLGRVLIHLSPRTLEAIGVAVVRAHEQISRAALSTEHMRSGSLPERKAEGGSDSMFKGASVSSLDVSASAWHDPDVMLKVAAEMDTRPLVKLSANAECLLVLLRDSPGQEPTATLGAPHTFTNRLACDLPSHA